MKLGWEEKLERDNQESEDNLELAKRKVCEVILTHIKSLKGNFSEYIENASDHVIDQIQNCCFAFMDGRCPCKRRGSEILAKLIRKDIRYKKMILMYQEMRLEKYYLVSRKGVEFSHCYLELFYQLLYLHL